MNFCKKTIKKESQKLVSWFAQEQRPLPWRQTQDPYGIWIAEVMLQQTTVKAVLPFYENFIKRFPKVKDLAKASIEEVYPYWAGLGYYSRARNLHRAAQEITSLGQFPKSYSDLLKLPGFGPYTARAVSSQAFHEPVGVVDGNVIRVLSRRWDWALEHWKTGERQELQNLADLYAQVVDNPSWLNQALMELGATLCRPQNPSCLLCPLSEACLALKQDHIDRLPLKKPKRASEIWIWRAEIYQSQGRLAIIKNPEAPFLKNQWTLPGQLERASKKPDHYDFQHAITHHKIYVQVTRKKSKFHNRQNLPLSWVTPKGLKAKAPFSLIQKAIALGLGDRN